MSKKLEGKVKLHEPQIMLAPWPKDIIWANLTITNAVRGTKRLIGYALFLLLCVFWLFPIGLLSTAAQIQNIIKIGNAYPPTHLSTHFTYPSQSSSLYISKSPSSSLGSSSSSSVSLVSLVPLSRARTTGRPARSPRARG